jgi:hypothetical protein
VDRKRAEKIAVTQREDEDGHSAYYARGIKRHSPEDLAQAFGVSVDDPSLQIDQEQWHRQQESQRRIARQRETNTSEAIAVRCDFNPFTGR